MTKLVYVVEEVMDYGIDHPSFMHGIYSSLESAEKYMKARMLEKPHEELSIRTSLLMD